MLAVVQVNTQSSYVSEDAVAFLMQRNAMGAGLDYDCKRTVLISKGDVCRPWKPIVTQLNFRNFYMVDMPYTNW